MYNMEELFFLVISWNWWNGAEMLNWEETVGGKREKAE
jgi:hypothetical protein